MSVFVLESHHRQLRLVAGQPWRSALQLFSQVANNWLNSLIEAAGVTALQVEVLHYSYATEERHVRRLATGEEIRLHLGLTETAGAFASVSFIQKKAPELSNWIVAGKDDRGQQIDELEDLYAALSDLGPVHRAQMWLISGMAETTED